MGERTPAWAWPAGTMALILWSLAMLGAGIEAGYDKALKERDDVRYYVNAEMREIGFCKWLEISDFANECARRQSSEEGR